MRLETIESNEGEVRQENIADLGTEVRYGNGKGEADLVDEGVEKKPGKRGGEVKVRRRGAPVRGMASKYVVTKGGEFGPEREAEPEI